MPKARDFLKAFFVGNGVMGSLVRGGIAAAAGGLVVKGYVTAEHADAVANTAGALSDALVSLLGGSVLGGLNLLLSRANKKI